MALSARERLTTGGSTGSSSVTATVTESLLPPPGPLQESVNVLPVVNGPVEAEPWVARGPLHPPDAEQLVALLDDQIKVVAEPLSTDAAEEERSTPGAGSGWMTATWTDSWAVPLAPVQVSVKLMSAFRGPTIWFPETERSPVQLPPARQIAALLADQFRVTLSPASTVVRSAVKLMVGSGSGIGVGSGSFGSGTG